MRKLLLITLLPVLLIAGCKSSILDDPSTVIQYTIPQKSIVKLTIENSYNTVVATLVNEEQQAGSYGVSFNMSDLPEGIYFYTVECTGIDNDFYFKTERYMIMVK